MSRSTAFVMMREVGAWSGLVAVMLRLAPTSPDWTTSPFALMVSSANSTKSPGTGACASAVLASIVARRAGTATRSISRIICRPSSRYRTHGVSHAWRYCLGNTRLRARGRDNRSKKTGVSRSRDRWSPAHCVAVGGSSPEDAGANPDYRVCPHALAQGDLRMADADGPALTVGGGVARAETRSGVARCEPPARSATTQNSA